MVENSVEVHSAVGAAESTKANLSTHRGAGPSGRECRSSCRNPEIDLSPLWTISYLDGSQTFTPCLQVTTALTRDLTTSKTAGYAKKGQRLLNRTAGSRMVGTHRI